MTCPTCGYVFQPFENYCPKCARLARTHQVQAPAGYSPPQPQYQAAPPPYKICPMCAQPAVQKMARCGRCGYTYSRPDTSNPQRNLAMGLGLFFLILVTILGASALRPGGRQAGRSGGSAGFGGAALTSKICGEVDNRLLRSAATVGGEIEVSLMWDTLSDLDVEVKDPAGQTVEAEHPRSSSGGEQDVDANPTPLSLQGQMKVLRGVPPGVENLEPILEFLIDIDKQSGPLSKLGKLSLGGFDGRAPSKYTRKPIEHIYYAHAPRGEYIVYTRCYSWREPTQQPLSFWIQVRSGGKVIKEVQSTIGPTNYVADGIEPTEVCRFSLQ